MNLQRHFAPPSTSYPSRDGQFVLATDAAALVAERDELAEWKRQQLVVESWWQKIDDYVRNHPDVRVGASVSSTALEWVKEHATLRARVAELTTELGQVAEARDAASKRVAELEYKFRPENFAQHQCTECGKCNKRKHTPWRDDEHGYGYVCATCLVEIYNEAAGALRAEVARLRQILSRVVHSIRENRFTHLDGFEEAKQALTAAPVATEGWRLIESAPRDRAVLLWRQGLEHACIGDCGPTRNGIWYIYGGGSVWIANNQPTHWRPLPPPPAQEGGEGK